MNRVWDFTKYGDCTALIDENGGALTYGQLDAQGRKLAEAAGERCLAFILCQNSIGAVLGYTAFLNNGIVPVLLNARLDSGFLDNLACQYRPSFFWVPQGMEVRGTECVYRAFDYKLLKAQGGGGYPVYGGLALLLTTSGSTGSPKLVRQSYTNICANTDSIVEYLHLDRSERAVTTLPMNYTYGLSIINTHLKAGGTVLLTDKGLMQKEFWTFMKGQEATSFGGVPYTYEMLDRLRFYRMELPHLRTLTQAGGKLTPELHEKFARYAREKNKRFVVMYGQCEATARMGYLPPERTEEKKGSMGIAIPGGRFTLLDAQGQAVTKPYTTGELVYEGANVTLGYAESRADLAKGDERGGKLATGDMAQFDADGYFYIVGRKKRFLKIYGNRVNLDEVERMIKGRYQADVACAGVDDHMYLFLTNRALADEVRNFAVQKTGLNPAAFQVKIIDSIPKNDSGKIQYAGLELYFDC